VYAVVSFVSRFEHAPGVDTTGKRYKEDGMAVTFQRNVGMLLLAVWLILYGLAGMIALALPSPLMAVLALLAGVLILVGR
jgi:hypothetical protein